MKKKCKVLAILCAATMMLTLSACGATEDSSADAGGSTTPETEQSSMAEATDSISEDTTDVTASEEATEQEAESAPEPETISRLLSETYYKEDGSFSYQYVYEYDEVEAPQ